MKVGFLGALVGMCCLLNSAIAGFDYRLEFDNASYSGIAGGGPVSIQVYLAEEVSGGDTSSFGDLLGVRFRLAYDNASAVSFNSFAFNTGLAPLTGTQSGAGFVDVFVENNSATLAVNSATRKSLLLGTFSFNPVNEGVVNLSLVDAPDAFGGGDPEDLLINAPLSLLDFSALPAGAVFTPGSAVLNVVPEPSALALFGLVSGLGLIVRRRRA